MGKFTINGHFHSLFWHNQRVSMYFFNAFQAPDISNRAASTAPSFRPSPFRKRRRESRVSTRRPIFRAENHNIDGICLMGFLDPYIIYKSPSRLWWYNLIISNPSIRWDQFLGFHGRFLMIMGYRLQKANMEPKRQPVAASSDLRAAHKKKCPSPNPLTHKYSRYTRNRSLTGKEAASVPISLVWTVSELSKQPKQTSDFLSRAKRRQGAELSKNGLLAVNDCLMQTLSDSHTPLLTDKFIDLLNEWKNQGRNGGSRNGMKEYRDQHE